MPARAVFSGARLNRRLRRWGLAPLPFFGIAAALLSGCGGSASSTTGAAPTLPADSLPASAHPALRPAEQSVIGRPCPGVVVRSDAPVPRNTHNRVTLVLETEKRWRGASFDWWGPYFDADSNDNRPWSWRHYDYPRLLEVNIEDWRVETTATVTRHTIDLRWPPFLEVVLDLHSGEDSCELPRVVCDAGGCELREK